MSIKDSEGVVLRQRRDQLSRRLREVKQWIKHARVTGSLVHDHGAEAEAEVAATNNAGGQVEAGGGSINSGKQAEAATALLNLHGAD